RGSAHLAARGARRRDGGPRAVRLDARARGVPGAHRSAQDLSGRQAGQGDRRHRARPGAPGRRAGGVPARQHTRILVHARRGEHGLPAGSPRASACPKPQRRRAVPADGDQCRCSGRLARAHQRGPLAPDSGADHWRAGGRGRAGAPHRAGGRPARRAGDGRLRGTVRPPRAASRAPEGAAGDREIRVLKPTRGARPGANHLMTVHAELTDLALRQQSDLLHRRAISPVELTEAYLARIAALNGTLNAYYTVTDEAARAQAQQAEAELAAGTDRGPLHGIPVGLKDLVATAGVRTTAGSKILADWVPTTDATVVQ